VIGPDVEGRLIVMPKTKEIYDELGLNVAFFEDEKRGREFTPDFLKPKATLDHLDLT